MSSLFKGHVIGHNLCPQCYGAYPKKCWCGGMIHVRYIEEGKMQDFLGRMYVFLCDGCSSDADFVDEKDPEEDS